MMDKKEFIKPNIVVSKCLNIDNCRYDNSMISFPLMNVVRKFCNVHTVCPEMAIGLGSPRKPMRLQLDGDIHRFVVTETSEELTEKMKEFSYGHIFSLDKYEIQGAIFKSKSPSCGLEDTKLYKGDRKQNYMTSGVYTRIFINNMIYTTSETEGRLMNLKLREHYFTAVFTKAEFESIANMSHLVSFQTRFKYLFMMYDPEIQKVLGRIVANHNHKEFEEIKEMYRESLKMLFFNPPKEGNVVNTLEHIYGYFKTKVNDLEKTYFYELIEDFRNDKIVIGEILKVLKMWALHHNENYLINQSIFNPYPSELVVLMDSDSKYYKD